MFFTMLVDALSFSRMSVHSAYLPEMDGTYFEMGHNDAAEEDDIAE